MTRAELKAGIAELGGGTPQELADALDHPRDGSFKRALGELVDEGVFVTRGSTTNRFYVRAEDADPEGPPERDSVDEKLMALLPCPVHDFSEAAHQLGLGSQEIAARRAALEIETYKDEHGFWHCRHVPGYVPPSVGASGFGAAAQRGIDRGVARTEAFGRMSARAGHNGRIIGRGRDPRGG